MVVASTVCGAFVIWLYLGLLRGGFWRADQRLLRPTDVPDRWPDIVAVISARDEAETIAQAVRSIAGQDYPANMTIVVVDDGSTDGTAAEAKSVSVEPVVIDVIHGQPLPDGWTGKMWAVAQGIDRAARLVPDAEYLLLTDADIEHSPDSLRRLVGKAEQESFDLVSLMVKLRVRSPWEKLLIPAFVFFFQKLFPFPWVNNPKRPEAAIWLGLAEDSHSLRGYDGLRSVWNMVARTAFVQLKNSYILLFGTIFGMAVLYLIPPMAVLVGAWSADLLVFSTGFLTWIFMTSLYLSTVRLHGAPRWQPVFLPAAALFYTAMTLDSAWFTWRGWGAGGKGRTYGPPSPNPERQVGE